jgi:hypothetical protein
VAFSGQNPDAGRATNASNYTLIENEGSGKKAHQQTVPITPEYDPSTNSANLIFSGKHTFSNGGQLMVIPATSTFGPGYLGGPGLSADGIASDAGFFLANGMDTNLPDLLMGSTSFAIGHNGRSAIPIG